MDFSMDISKDFVWIFVHLYVFNLSHFSHISVYLSQVLSVWLHIKPGKLR